MLYHGLVQVPEDAETGSAIVRVELPETSRFKSRPTDLEVEIR